MAGGLICINLHTLFTLFARKKVTVAPRQVSHLSSRASNPFSSVIPHFFKSCTLQSHMAYAQCLCSLSRGFFFIFRVGSIFFSLLLFVALGKVIYRKNITFSCALIFLSVLSFFSSGLFVYGIFICLFFVHPFLVCFYFCRDI